MIHTQSHIVPLTKAPSLAQTVQQLKYTTLLVYLTNGLSLISNLGAQSNAITGLIDVLPYKGFFGGGGDGTTTS